MTNNVPFITSWANDTTHGDILAEELANLAQRHDIFIAISGRGTSPYVSNAMTFARQQGALTIGLAGLNDWRMKDHFDLCVVLPSSSMDQIEDFHLVVSHIISIMCRVLAKRARTMPSRAVFIDRDGVINENRSSYVMSWEEFKFLDGVLAGLAALAQSGLKIVVVTNQSAIGRQLVTRATVEEIHRRMEVQVRQAGGRIDGVFYCPHTPVESCGCRKPRSGLLELASRELGLDLASSYLIGDSLEDIEAAHAAGCTSVLVRTGRGAQALAQLNRLDGRRPVVFDDLRSAIEWILKREGKLDGVSRPTHPDVSVEMT